LTIYKSLVLNSKADYNTPTMDDLLQSPLGLLGFLSLFHVGGAIGLAHGLRGVWRGLRNRGQGFGNSLFFIVWGSMFGCMPFAFGVGLASEESGTPLVLLGEVTIWASVFLIALLAWDEAIEWLRPFLHPDMFLIAFGGVFMAAGTAAGAMMIREELLTALLVGGIFTLVGALIFGLGILNLLKAMR
jgi:hypothetical protein